MPPTRPSQDRRSIGPWLAAGFLIAGLWVKGPMARRERTTTDPLPARPDVRQDDWETESAAAHPGATRPTPSRRVRSASRPGRRAQGPSATGWYSPLRSAEAAGPGWAVEAIRIAFSRGTVRHFRTDGEDVVVHQELGTLRFDGRRWISSGAVQKSADDWGDGTP